MSGWTIAGVVFVTAGAISFLYAVLLYFNVLNSNTVTGKNVSPLSTIIYPIITGAILLGIGLSMLYIDRDVPYT